MWHRDSKQRNKGQVRLEADLVRPYIDILIRVLVQSENGCTRGSEEERCSAGERSIAYTAWRYRLCSNGAPIDLNLEEDSDRSYILCFALRRTIPAVRVCRVCPPVFEQGVPDVACV